MRASILVLAVLVALGCDQDPMGFREREMISGFRLQQWEDSTTFYLVGTNGRGDDGGGFLNGTVERIGWNSRYILAERKANFGGDADGWMIVDTANGTVIGPFPEAELSHHPEIHDVKIVSAAEAWRALDR